jgi:hypothetical protein
MTTIISRLFPDQKSAQSAADRLMFKGFPSRSCTVIAGDGAAARLERAQVEEAALPAYHAGLSKGQAVLAIKATYKPLGALSIARKVLDGYDTVDIGAASEERELPWQPERAGSVLKDHPLFLTVPGTKLPHGPISANFGMPMTKPHSDKRPLIDRRMSRLFWPMKLLSTKPRKTSVYHGGRFMSRSFWPAPLLSTKTRSKSVIPGGALPFSRLFGMPTISR